MKNKPKRISQRWRRGDHYFAVATTALMVFLLVAGLGAWLLDQKPAGAVVGSPAAAEGAR
jgi:hypothetical protein